MLPAECLQDCTSGYPVISGNRNRKKPKGMRPRHLLPKLSTL